jgi:phosphoglycolate phosphatase-like HAD superfamily hydrolase
MSTPLYIFDLDGTLANIDHRLHFIEGPRKYWDSFFAACDKDVPIPAVLKICLSLQMAGNEVWFWTGRSEAAEDKTIAWLDKWGLKTRSWRTPDVLMMRAEGDFRPDHIIKQEWLHRSLSADRERLVATFDDRQSVVDMWRRNGIPCMQVAPGDF